MPPPLFLRILGLISRKKMNKICHTCTLKNNCKLLFDTENDGTYYMYDADHNLQTVDIDKNFTETSLYRNASHKSKLRFHLTKRSRTLQGLLEKMFENELKEHDSAIF